MTFTEIYTQTNEIVLNHALNIVKDVQHSEDITMQVFAKIDRLNKNPLTCFNPEKSKITSYVITVTNSMIIDFFRSNKNKKFKFVSDFTNEDNKETFEFEAPMQSNADNNVLTTETQKRIEKAFHDLKPNYRRIGVLFFIREHSYDEISKMLDMPIGTVKGMLSRCREKLQIELKDLHVVRKTKAIA